MDTSKYVHRKSPIWEPGQLKRIFGLACFLRTSTHYEGSYSVHHLEIHQLGLLLLYVSMCISVSSFKGWLLEEHNSVIPTELLRKFKHFNDHLAKSHRKSITEKGENSVSTGFKTF